MMYPPTDEETTIVEAFEKIREHSSPLVLPLILTMERMWQFDRLRMHLDRERIALLTGESVISENDNHSRRVTDIRAVIG